MLFRGFEMLLAAWLLASPFVLPGSQELPGGWMTLPAAAAVVASVSLLSFARGLSKLHLLNGLVGLWLVASGMMTTPDAPPVAQSGQIVGLFLLMTAILPTRSFSPSREWTAYVERRRRIGMRTRRHLD